MRQRTVTNEIACSVYFYDPRQPIDLYTTYNVRQPLGEHIAGSTNED